MQKQSRDWLIAAVITLLVGVIATVVVTSGKVGSPLLGITTGAVIGAAVMNGRQVKIQQELKAKVLRQEERQKQLEAQVLKQEEWQRLRAQLPGLEARVNQLRQEQTDKRKYFGTTYTKAAGVS